MIPCVWLQFKLNFKDDGYHPSLSSILKKRPFCHEAEIAPQDQRFSHTYYYVHISSLFALLRPEIMMRVHQHRDHGPWNGKRMSEHSSRAFKFTACVLACGQGNYYWCTYFLCFPCWRFFTTYCRKKGKGNLMSSCHN